MIILEIEQQPVLIQAIFSGELEQVRIALEFKPDVNYQDCENRTPLHAASFKGDANIAALLLSHGARVNAKDNQWITPLHRACGCGSSSLVSVLLQHQADTTARDKYWQTPLHVAAANNAYNCITQLIEHVPNLNVTDRLGRTALHHAAVNGHKSVIELLISKGCIVNACDKKDQRPLHCASYMGHVEIIEVLLQNGADIDAKDRNQYTPLHVAAASGNISVCQMLLDCGAVVDARNAFGNTPLHIACLNGHVSVCQVLLFREADTESVNYRGQTPLHIAAASTAGVECLNYLVKQNVDINKQSLDGRTPLHMTAIHGRFTRSKTLIDKGATVDCVDKNGCTPLHIAAQYGHDLLANTLLLYGADPSKRGYGGRTPLHMTCLSGYIECCRKFLQAHVDINSQDDSGKTPIHCAAYKGSVECLDLLVSSGANFCLVDNIGRIPLHYAASQGHYPCVFTLVGMGSPVNLCDSEGCSPLHLAAAYDTKGECVEYLLRHKANPSLKDLQGFTPIHYAVAGGNFTSLGFLLPAVGNDYPMYGLNMPLTTPLHLAARNGNQDILGLLLSHFHDINIRAEHGSTALLLAARAGHAHCVQMLLRYGAKAAITDNIHNMSPVHYSAKNGHMHCLALLLDNTEDKNVINLLDSLQRTALMLAVSSGHPKCANTLLKSGANPNILDGDLHSALFRAVVNGEHNTVQLLISHDAEVNKMDIHGKTVLHLAAACRHLSSMRVILTYMPLTEAAALDNQECTALHWACYNGNPDCVLFLLEKDIFKNFEGNLFSPLHCATFAGSERSIELLCNYFGDSIVKLKDARNRTSLHIAALHGHVECAKFLIEHGAEIECKDSDGRTPLVAASQNGQTQIIDLLISYKADMTSYDNNGNTALHSACLKCHNHTALLLLENIHDEAIVNMINNDRKTALHLAARNGLVSITEQLIKKGSSILAVDANGMTPALCCAPDNNVAQCLALILSNYTVCSPQGGNTKDTNPIHKFLMKPLKTFINKDSQTDLSLIHKKKAPNPDIAPNNIPNKNGGTPIREGSKTKLKSHHKNLFQKKADRNLPQSYSDTFVVSLSSNCNRKIEQETKSKQGLKLHDLRLLPNYCYNKSVEGKIKAGCSKLKYSQVQLPRVMETQKLLQQKHELLRKLNRGNNTAGNQSLICHVLPEENINPGHRQLKSEEFISENVLRLRWSAKKLRNIAEKRKEKLKVENENFEQKEQQQQQPKLRVLEIVESESTKDKIINVDEIIRRKKEKTRKLSAKKDEEARKKLLSSSIKLVQSLLKFNQNASAEDVEEINKLLVECITDCPADVMQIVQELNTLIKEKPSDHQKQKPSVTDDDKKEAKNDSKPTDSLLISNYNEKEVAINEVGLDNIASEQKPTKEIQTKDAQTATHQNEISTKTFDVKETKSKQVGVSVTNIETKESKHTQVKEIKTKNAGTSTNLNRRVFAEQFGQESSEITEEEEEEVEFNSEYPTSPDEINSELIGDVSPMNDAVEEGLILSKKGSYSQLARKLIPKSKESSHVTCTIS